MSIRLRILVGCLAMLAVTIALGTYERQQARALGGLATQIYERSLLGISYARSAQTNFIRHMALSHGTSGDAVAGAAKFLKDALEDLAVAIERPNSDEARQQAVALQAQLAAYRAKPDLASLASIDEAFDGLIETLTADGFTQRRGVDAMIIASERSIQFALAASIVVALCITAVLGASIVRPVRRAVTVATAIANGRLDNAIRSHSRGELARLLQSLASMQAAIAESVAEREARAVAEEERHQIFQERLIAALQRMADKVEGEASAVLDQVGLLTDLMSGSAAEMSHSAERTNLSSADATRAADTALAATQSVARAMDLVSASIHDIGAELTESVHVVEYAVQAGTETRATIEALDKSVAQISSVTSLINEIAARTQLLALNATIEAVRAGEAGTGFVVVAGEVKQLAALTARSTREIAEHIDQVRMATGASIEAASRIGEALSQMHVIAAKITASVEKQQTATDTIAQNVEGTAAAARIMHERIRQVSDEARNTDACAAEVGRQAVSLARAIQALKATVVRVVRTATIEVNRRTEQRYDVDMTCVLALPGSTNRAGRVTDVSEGGAQIRGVSGLTCGTDGTLILDQFGLPLPITVRRVMEGSVGVALRLDQDQSAKWRDFLNTLSLKAAA